MKKEFDLDERLLEFALRALQVVESLPETRVCLHLGNQLMRSGTSVALNYGEAQASESPKDFVHKMKVVLKELRESYSTVRILKAKSLLSDAGLVGENNELIAIFVTSIKTATRNASNTRVANSEY